MQHPGFFDRAGPFSIAEIAAATGATPAAEADTGQNIADVLPLNEAQPDHITFVDNRKYVKQLARTRAGE